MISDEKKLIELRNEIDSIDDAIHDLIMRRTKVVEGVCEIKRDSAVKIRPSREASLPFPGDARHCHGRSTKNIRSLVGKNDTQKRIEARGYASRTQTQ